jgi:cell wall-associated NlpC family hydrolase
MPGKNPRINYNSIEIKCIPNPQYLQTDFSDDDVFLAEGIKTIAPNQILKVEIFKSFETKVTDVHIHLQYMDPTLITELSEGKFVIALIISPATTTPDQPSFINYFLVDYLEPKGDSQIFGTYAAINAKVVLKSILRQRLEIENHLSYELGGKGGSALVGSGIRPIEFLMTEINQRITDAYSTQDLGGASDSYFDLSATASNDNTVTIDSGPSTGYILDTDTNFKALDYFFTFYPLFKTPYVWLIDDFNTNLTTSSTYLSSRIRILDMVKYQSWATSFNTTLSDIMNGEFQGKDKIKETNSVKKEVNGDVNTSLGMFSLMDYRSIKIVSYFNVSRFMFRDNFPLIYAERIHDSSPIDMQAWNAMASENNVLTSGPTGLRVKKIKNPMYKYYLTFMSPQEIAETQKFKGLFMMMNPSLVTYIFDNLFIGIVDIQTSILLKAKNMGKYESFGEDKFCTGYQVKHTFVASPPSSATQQSAELDNSEEAKLFPNHFKLTSEITFLQVDIIPNDLTSYDQIQRKRALSDVFYTTTDLTLFNTINACGDFVDVDLGNLPVAEPGSPGNDSILSAAKTLIDHGFIYVWGGLAANGMDCSAFTMYSVHNSGADAGRKTRYPRTTKTQKTWLDNPANGAVRVKNVDDIQPGDIVFFKTESNGPWGHTGIAIDKTSYYHSNSYKKKGADKGSFSRRRPAYIYRLLPMNKKV